MIRIELTGPEILLGANVGVLRRCSALAKGRQERFGGSWTEDINGAHAEQAFAKHRNVFWSGTIGRVDRPDVGPYQVRSKRAAHHCLIIYPEDCDEDVFVSVLVEGRRCTLTGWLYGREAKRECWWREPPAVKCGAFFVPDPLRPIEELPGL